MCHGSIGSGCTHCARKHRGRNRTVQRCTSHTSVSRGQQGAAPLPRDAHRLPSLRHAACPPRRHPRPEPPRAPTRGQPTPSVRTRRGARAVLARVAHERRARARANRARAPSPRPVLATHTLHAPTAGDTKRHECRAADVLSRGLEGVGGSTPHDSSRPAWANARDWPRPVEGGEGGAGRGRVSGGRARGVHTPRRVLEWTPGEEAHKGGRTNALGRTKEYSLNPPVHSRFFALIGKPMSVAVSSDSLFPLTESS